MSNSPEFAPLNSSAGSADMGAEVQCTHNEKHDRDMDEDGYPEAGSDNDSLNDINSDATKIDGKRVRKKVQRLSETISKAFEETIEQRAKIAKQITESLGAGKGTELGSIPLIEDSLRKTKPINLKPFHLMVYGRFGSMNEVRSNLRKFRGFSFGPGSKEYEKKLATMHQRPTNEIREVLRLLHLETSGTRETMVTRLMDFLLHPMPDKVKYKGKLIKKRGKHKSSVEKQTGPKKARSKATSSEATSENVSRTEEDLSDLDESLSSDHSEPVKKHRKPLKKENGMKGASRKRVIVGGTESDTDNDTMKHANKAVKHMNTDQSVHTDSEEDIPLSNLATQHKTGCPTEEELKARIIDILKTVDLEHTSLKVVREQLFARYPNVDLTDKKEFVNSTVKDYLARA